MLKSFRKVFVLFCFVFMIVLLPCGAWRRARPWGQPTCCRCRSTRRRHFAGRKVWKNYKKFSIRSEWQMCPIYVKLTLYHANDELKKSNFRKKVFGIIIITKINSYTNNELKNKIRTFMIFTFQSLSKKVKYPPKQTWIIKKLPLRQTLTRSLWTIFSIHGRTVLNLKFLFLLKDQSVAVRPHPDGADVVVGERKAFHVGQRHFGVGLKIENFNVW